MKLLVPKRPVDVSMQNINLFKKFNITNPSIIDNINKLFLTDE